MPFLSRHGLKLGSSSFSRYQNNRGSSGVYVRCIFCSLSVKINMREMQKDMRISRTHLFCVCCRQNPKTPTLSPMADDIIQGCESSSFLLISSFLKISCVKISAFLLFSAYFWHFTLISQIFFLFFLHVATHTSNHYTGQYTRSGISLVYLWRVPYLILRTYRHEHV